MASRYFPKVLVSIGIFCLLFALSAQAQVQLIPAVKTQFFSSTGVPLAGGCVFTYVSGTSIPLATYTDYTGGTPNPNPVILGSDGRPPNDIWLAGQAYRVQLWTSGGTNCATGTQIWSEDGISGNSSLLGTNNTWTGSNAYNGATTFNGSVTLQAGFTANGPAIMSSGGTMNGSWLGTPTLANNWTFSSGLTTTGITTSGQIDSTVMTGTPPFVIASTTEVPNLNVAQLEGCTWEVPCHLGSTTPNAVDATTLNAHTSFTLNGSTPLTSVQGTGVKVQAAGTIASGAGHGLCTDANGNDTTAGCSSSGFTQIETVSVCASGCNVTATPCSISSGASYDVCTNTITWPTPFADSSYSVVCTGALTGAHASAGNGSTNYALTVFPQQGSYGTTSFILVTQNQRTNTAAFDRFDCTGVHP